MNLLIWNAAQVVTPLGRAAACGGAMRQIQVLADTSVLIRDGKIDWIGPGLEAPTIPPATPTLDATGKVLLPGLVDSHTHLIFAGSREAEFEQRLQGKTYSEIAAQGGGINATVARVRQASREELKTSARRRLQLLLQFGVTTVEVTRASVLSPADELNCL